MLPATGVFPSHPRPEYASVIAAMCRYSRRMLVFDAVRKSFRRKKYRDQVPLPVIARASLMLPVAVGAKLTMMMREMPGASGAA